MAGKKKGTRWSKLRRSLQRLFEATIIFIVSGAISFAIFSYPYWKSIQDEATALADAHQNHEISHPGWSFPGEVWSAAAPLSLPKKRRIEHAKIRKYKNACPAKNPGEYCSKTGTVIPRGGLFPDGSTQPPGTKGWTRPLAMEPVYMAMLLGPDAEIREHLPLKEAPKVLLDAIVASEDMEFYEHVGVNFRALIRAAWINYQGKSYSQGASTITMQVVRNLNQKREKTLQRKIREIVAAIAIDSHLGKDGVMQMYLDAPYLGQKGNLSVSGFAAAAKHYWNVDIRDISLDQAATLVGILPAPGKFRPDKFPKKALKRRNLVLNRMKKLGWKVDEALQKPLKLNIGELPPTLYPPYMQYTLTWLKDNLGENKMYGTGLRVFTTMDLVVQRNTRKIFEERIPYLQRFAGLSRRKGKLESAATVIDPQTGYLLAVWGGTVKEATDFNRATQARRQAGSSFKPLVYALAFSQRDETGKPAWKTFDTVSNRRRVFPNTNGWKPKNIDGTYSSKATLSIGMVMSKNVATASLLEELGGPQKLIDFATDFGYDTSNFPAEMGLALGQGEVTPLEMSRFVATVANGGFYTKGQPVSNAIDIMGREQILTPPLGKQMLTPEAIALVRELMRLVIRRGTGGSTRGIGGKKGYREIAIGKTGTSNKQKDLWFMGSTPTYSGALWMGFDQPQNLRGTASDLAAPMWGWWMRAIHEGLPLKKEFPGLQLESHRVCQQTGRRSNGTCKTIPAPVLEGQKPSGGCPISHPPPDPDKPKRENMWRRRARLQEERKQQRQQESQGPNQEQKKKIDQWREKAPSNPVPFDGPVPRD